MVRIPYQVTPVEQLAFALSHPTRRYAVQQVLRRGWTSAPSLSLEFTEYDPTTLRDVLHVLKKQGFVRPGHLVMDAQGRRRELTYTATPALHDALHQLQTVVSDLLTYCPLEAHHDEPRPE